MTTPPKEALPISVRAYVHPLEAKKSRGDWGGSLPPSDEVLIFDTETTTDEAQALRFGTYQYRVGEALNDQGIFFDPDALTPEEIATITRFAAARHLKVMTRAEFVDHVLYARAYDCGATIVGFNLPFDLSRIAIGHGPARRKMRGGFSLKLTDDTWRPRVQVKHLSQRTSLIRFSSTSKQTTPRGMRKRGLKSLAPQGYFVDVKTLAGALLSGSFSLDRLCKDLRVASPKLEAERHGAPIDDDYLTYAMRDPQATWECYQELVRRYRSFGLSTRPDQIYSEASLGKAYLKEMGVQPWRKMQPDFPDQLLGYILSTYYGGRSEVRIRRKVVQVLHCDFVSMYPTVCTLMGLWRFVIAEGMTHRDSTDEIRELLQRVTLRDLQSPTFWPQLTVIVQLKPDATLLPVRAKYDGADQATIGLNYLSADQSLWYTLADVIAAKLLTGSVPAIERAIIFEPGPPQSNLAPVKIGGNADYTVDPATDDFYRRLIDLRRKVKGVMDSIPSSDEAAKAALDQEQNALKIAANATSYGIFVEVNVNEAEKKQPMICEGPSGVPFQVQTANIEEPGKYFHPLLASLITGAARLMLGLVERLTSEEGLEWAMCDTDSMAIAKPDDLPEADFIARAKTVCAWFDPLNPYETKGPILKIEDANFGRGDSKRLKPLYCFAVSAKRYALFNLDDDGAPILRAASAHGLGHLHAPYTAANPAEGVPQPLTDLGEIGVELWQHDLWWQIVSAALRGESDRPNLNYHPALNLPATSRYAATTPEVLRWFDKHNRNKPYQRQVRPFGFMVSLLAKAWSDVTSGGDAGARKRRHPVRPVAAFTREPSEAAENAFDRDTNGAVPRRALKSYRQLLAQYQLHPEAKFLNADYTDAGVTERRHVFAVEIRHIGKEANKWEQQYFVGVDEEAEIDYGAAPSIEGKFDEQLSTVLAHVGAVKSAKLFGVTGRHLRRLLTGEQKPTTRMFKRVSAASTKLVTGAPGHPHKCP